jgi:hypothetical protein
MTQKASSSTPSWREQLYKPEFISRLEHAEPEGLRFTGDHIRRIDGAITLTIHWKSHDEAAADKRLDKIRKVVASLVPLLESHIEKDKPSGMPPKRCIPGCEDALAFLDELKTIVSAGRRERKPRGRGHPSDEVTDFMLQSIWKIYCKAGGTGATGSKAFARFLAELAKVMPKHLLGSHKDPARWLIRRAKDLGR